jgi:hypothetical protein
MESANAASKPRKQTRDALHRENSDTSPPNGTLPVNRRLISAGRRERAWNQQFDMERIRRGHNPFTRVNARSASQCPICKRTDRQRLPSFRRLTSEIARFKLFSRRVFP